MEPEDDHSRMLPTVSLTGPLAAPRLIEVAGPQAKRRFFEFFTANIRNKNTRQGLRTRPFGLFCLV